MSSTTAATTTPNTTTELATPATTQTTQETTTTQTSPDDKIDTLLARYLVLLDEYTTLRTTLNNLQKTLFQNLARANFQAERGVAYYAKDYYDERMQASRKLNVLVSEKDGLSIPEFTLNKPFQPPAGDDKASPERGGEIEKQTAEGAKTKIQDSDGVNDTETKEPENVTDEKDKKTKKKAPNTDPLRWFGILTPLALRQAQGVAVTAVEDIIPRLASVSLEMAEVELEVRRARKKRAKAEKEEEKKKKRLQPQDEDRQELAEKIGGLDVNDEDREPAVGVGA
ncbi:hypothetical protein QBC35DRAFT_515891 [Podospora australis]|uniref:Vacuolar ATPase assembly protein VMA22 n=1 Tax=Podospora australis TaxID=1536484 RepID=A0AAN6WUX3_9PEZI|nr:hypothetical protein QBC35DRAFT_515891 [Podospora australis]